MMYKHIKGCDYNFEVNKILQILKVDTNETTNLH